MIRIATAIAGTRRCLEVKEPDEVLGQHHRDGSHGSRLDQEQQRPALQEGDERMEGVAKVGILPAHARHDRRQLGEHEGAGQGDQAARRPRGQDQDRRPYDLGHEIRVDEDAAADDGGEHDHRGAEEPEPTREGGMPERRHPCLVPSRFLQASVNGEKTPGFRRW
jgi:hypothetical protein